MCGRFTQAYTWQELHEMYNLISTPLNLRPRYNIAPTQSIDCIRLVDGKPELVKSRWGLIPGWWKKSAKEAPATFNARGETVAEKPFFRSAFKKRRCLISASGFYEWKREGEVKQPYFISRVDRPIMLFAGIWDQWTDIKSKEDIVSCSIITTAPNDMMSSIHNRMPVILSPEDGENWMEGTKVDLLKPCPSEWLQAWRVSRDVNNASKHDHPRLIEPLE
jgi:putative SOS response-associated peptidase YedK